MIGRTLGHYRVLETLGKGGMGEVYRAHDEVLGRDVAIKVLPEEFSADPERLARFEREAKVLAALNHSNVGAIYGLERDDSQHYLVLELIEGETLAERIDSGPIPVEEAVPLAIQIAEGLEAAHQKGMIHRDLKPANIKITPDGEVKVLDFGLAKPTEAVFSGDLSESPTLTYSPTGVGVILGTAAYMSPEQVRGKELDQRADIWAFGVVLWEMLTGKKLFQGDTVSDVLAATLTREPQWEWLPATLPAGVRRVLRHCLAQDPKERLHDIADARIELQEVLDEPEEEQAVASIPRPWWRRALPWAAVVVALAAGWLLRPTPEVEPLPVRRLEVRAPDGEQVAHGFRRGVALSPDGSLLAFVSGVLSLEDLSWDRRIQLRRFDEWESRPVLGTEGGRQPIFSPDGEWLAFIADDPPRLLKVPTNGGETQTLCECDASFGASWGPNGSIVFASERGPLQEVSVAGGEPRPLTELLESEGETGHRLPHFLPDGSAVIFTVVFDYRDWDRAQIIAYTPSNGERRLLVQGGSDAQYVSSGHLVFARQGKLFAVAFDPTSLETFGAATPVLDGVNHSIHSLVSNWRTGVANFHASRSGSIAYLAGSVFPEARKGVALVDRRGNRVDVEPSERKQFLAARVSPDGRSILLSTHYYPDSVWLLDLDRETLSRQTFEGRQRWAIWGPGPDEFTTSSYRDGEWQIFSKVLGSGPGSTRVLWSGEHEVWVGSWSPDGNHLAVVVQGEVREESSLDISILSTDGTFSPFLDSDFLENFPEFSVDGRWIAYVSNESGRGEVFVRPFPGPGPAVQISVNGGWAPTWSRDGSELYYRSDDGWFMAVAVDGSGERFSIGRTEQLFEDSYGSTAPVKTFDVTADGRFVIPTYPPQEAFAGALNEFFPDRIQVVQNWAEELRQKLPTDH